MPIFSPPEGGFFYFFIMSSLPISDSNAYAIIEKNGVITLYQGLLHHFNSLDEVEALQKKTQKTVVFLVPHCSIRERGYEAKGKEPIIVLEAKDQTIFTKEEISKLLPTKKIKLQGDIIPSISDNEFSHLVEKVQKKEIQRGNATQVVISRRFEGKLDTKCEENALSIFRQLLDQKGQYMTIVFVEKQKGFYLVGATPERHLEITNDSTIMMPIAGTLPKGDLVTFPKRLRSFLQDKKEINELFQVLDEECKMMARICPYGGVIRGPLLRETGAVIHTEYGLFGYRTNLSLIQAFRETLHAPTLVGGPLESSARIIAHYEKDSRRYYGGEICVLRPDQTFDSAILIRCAEIDKEGNISVQAGAGIVRDSVPKKETAETRAKAEGLLSLLQQKISVSDFYLTSDREQEISPLLRERNEFLSRFLCDDQSDLTITNKLSNTQITIINNEDNFSHVLGHMLGHMKYGYKIVDTFEFDVKGEMFGSLAELNVNGKVIMYGDKITPAMKKAIEETDSRRNAQLKYNEKHGITPQTIKKAIEDDIFSQFRSEEEESYEKLTSQTKELLMLTYVSILMENKQ